MKDIVLPGALSQAMKRFWESSNYEDNGIKWLWLGAIRALEEAMKG